MTTNTTNQTAKDIAHVVEIIAQRQYELEATKDACMNEVSELNILALAAQETLKNLRSAA